MMGHTSLAWLVDGFVRPDHNHPARVAAEANGLFVHKRLPQSGLYSEEELTIRQLIVVGKLCTEWNTHK